MELNMLKQKKIGKISNIKCVGARYSELLRLPYVM